MRPVQSPVAQLPLLSEDSPIVSPSQWMTSAAGTSSNKQDLSTSTDSESKKLNTVINQSDTSSTSDGRSVKGSSAHGPFSRKRSSSVSFVSSSKSSDNSSRRPTDELLQKLNRRLSKESDLNALEKFESTVQQNMSQNRFMAGTQPVPVSWVATKVVV